MPIRILIADDHAAVRRSMRTVLGAHPEWEICGEAQNGQEALAAAQLLHPDIMILDITMPQLNGLEVAREIARLNLSTRVLICSTHASHTLGEVVKHVGAQGYALKSAPGRVLLDAVETLLDGRTYFSGDLPRTGIQHTAQFAAAVRELA
jgi:DNA-binding NarL/FixJ family response regulator